MTIPRVGGPREETHLRQLQARVQQIVKIMLSRLERAASGWFNSRTHHAPCQRPRVDGAPAAMSPIGRPSRNALLILNNR